MASMNKRQGRRWTPDEHAQFMRGLEMFPQGPWSRIAALVGTRTTRQTMTHAQKYRERILRRASEDKAIWAALGQPPILRLGSDFPSAPMPTDHLLSSSEEDLFEAIGLGADSHPLDELDMHILMSLFSPETDNQTAAHSLSLDKHDPNGELVDAETSIWSLLADSFDLDDNSDDA